MVKRRIFPNPEYRPTISRAFKSRWIKRMRQKGGGSGAGGLSKSKAESMFKTLYGTRKVK